jgi:hypothetical protein
MITADPVIASSVATAFERVSTYLRNHHPAITVHTADYATYQSPWFLAWTDQDGPPDLLIYLQIGANSEWCHWADADPEALLATLGQLPELLTRAQQAGQVLARLALPTRLSEAVAEVERALAVAKGNGE